MTKGGFFLAGFKFLAYVFETEKQCGSFPRKTKYSSTWREGGKPIDANSKAVSPKTFYNAKGNKGLFDAGPS